MSTKRVVYTHARLVGFDWCDECLRESKALFNVYLIDEESVGTDPLRVGKCVTDEEHEQRDES